MLNQEKIKNIIILGVTGSIGLSALRLLRKNNRIFNLIGVSAHNNARLLSEIVNEFNVTNVVLSNKKNIDQYFGKFDLNSGETELINLASIKCDMVISGISGLAGLHSAYAAISSGNDLAIANKETLVSAGKLFMEKARETCVKILPVDSEHSAIFQCIDQKNIRNLDHITLTASGGPFLNTPINELEYVTSDDAIKHPVWDMGKKISIDSATMINKALEIIEASVLFDLNKEKIEVVIHPQSIIHGLVHYKDGSIIANLAYPDMITPLSVALAWPNRLDLKLKKLSLIEIHNLSFIKPDFNKFPSLQLGWDCLDNPNCSAIVLNAANEIVVDNFLKNKIKFTDIFFIISEMLNIYNPSKPNNIDDVIEIDKLTRIKTIEFIKRKL
ncbi:1-deoxy-D-xylulose-5-phosphate reductoisomerase [Alphaproteobacteria bacterium]|nr:1-deoxy-D-xylulose-5-phosphate reductoisomerase [Alphaproteobacteria bacterium]